MSRIVEKLDDRGKTKIYVNGKDPLWLSFEIWIWLFRNCQPDRDDKNITNRQIYNQHEVSPICKLCNLEPEDREHFILRCPILETKRKFYLHQLFELLREHSKEQLLNTVREEQEKLMICIMDCTNPIFNLDVKKELDLISEIEEIIRNLTFDLHNCRAVNIKDCLWFRQFLYGKSYFFYFRK